MFDFSIYGDGHTITQILLSVDIYFPNLVVGIKCIILDGNADK